jgi:tRNA G18 (ribose-2'-O)-methylase SpoU
MSLAILLTQCKVAGIHTLASSAHDKPGAFPPKSGVSSPGFDHAKTNEPSATNAPFLAPWEVDWCQPIALLVGNEGAGLPEEVERSADVRIHIPMASGVESLNAAAAAAVVFYEAARQRNSTLRQL